MLGAVALICETAICAILGTWVAGEILAGRWHAGCHAGGRLGWVDVIDRFVTSRTDDAMAGR